MADDRQVSFTDVRVWFTDGSSMSREEYADWSVRRMREQREQREREAHPGSDDFREDAWAEVWGFPGHGAHVQRAFWLQIWKGGRDWYVPLYVDTARQARRYAHLFRVLTGLDVVRAMAVAHVSIGFTGWDYVDGHEADYE